LIASNSPPGIDINPATGMLSFEPTGVNAAPGRWKVNVTITDAATPTPASVTTDIYITVDGVTGSSAPASLTMPAVESIQNTAGLSGTGPYTITGYTQSMLTLGSSDTIHFDRNATITGTWLITAEVVDNGVRTTPTMPTAVSGNTVTYNSTTGRISLSSGDPLYPPGSAVVFTAVCTRTSDGAVGTTLLNVTMPERELSLTPGGSTAFTNAMYNVGDPQYTPHYIDVIIVPYAMVGATLSLIDTTNGTNSVFGDILLSTTVTNRIDLTNTVWDPNASTHQDTPILIGIDYKNGANSVIVAPINATINFLH
jgi:hypothetical protein